MTPHRRRPASATSICCVLCGVLAFGAAATEKPEPSERPYYADLSASIASLRHHGALAGQLQRELASDGLDARYRAVLRGLLWCVVFVDDDAQFRDVFDSYLVMLKELTVNHDRPFLKRFASEALRIAIDRGRPILGRLFGKTETSQWLFISILPTLVSQHEDLAPYQAFYRTRFAGVRPKDRRAEFDRAVKEKNYDVICDYLIEASFMEEAYRLGLDKQFRLPDNDYPYVMGSVEALPFEAGPGDKRYSDQNYLVTHVVLAGTLYGFLPLAPSPLGDRAFLYLLANYDQVRHKAGDLDLLCEYLYCLKLFAVTNVLFPGEGERYVLSRQHPDGSWGEAEDFEGDPYDRLHPTWTAITYLALFMK